MHDFEAALREADRQLADAGMPQDAERRVRQRVLERHDRGAASIVRRLLVPLAVAAMAMAILWFARPEPDRPRVDVPGLELLAQSSDFQAAVIAGQVEIQRGNGTFLVPNNGITLFAHRGVTLRSEPSGTRVVRGAVDVEVQKRRPGAPARILVSHGVIEVMGTRFTVVQDEASGSVVLHEGSIRFSAIGGRVVMLAPGQTLAWPLVDATHELAPSPTSPPGPPVPAPVSPQPLPPHVPNAPAHERATPAVPAVAGARPPEPVESDAAALDGLVDRIATLRSRGEYAAAARELDEALARKLPPSTAERLSFELGSIRTYQLGDRAQACAHWTRHLKAYPGGRYQEEAARAQQHLSCLPSE